MPFIGVPFHLCVSVCPLHGAGTTMSRYENRCFAFSALRLKFQYVILVPFVKSVLALEYNCLIFREPH